MAQRVEFELTADERKAVSAWLALQRSVESHNAAFAKLAVLTDQQTKATGSYNREQAKAEQLLRSLETDQERFNRRIGEASDLRKKGLLTEEQHARAVARANEELKKASATQQTYAQSVLANVGGMVTGYLSVGAAVGSIKSIVGEVIRANREMLQQVDEAGTKLDANFKKFAVQAGLQGLEREDAQSKIAALATKNAVGEDPLKYATSAATQLVSSGFSVEDATGGALDATLQAAAASNLGDSDPAALVQAAGQYLSAMGMEKNAENLKEVLIGSQRLFKATDFQVSDLSQLAGKSQGLAGVIDWKQALASFDVLREKTGADTASTALKIFGDRLRGAKEDKQRTDVLSEIGLTPEAVDLQGESVSEVLDRLAGGLESVDPTRRAGLLQKFFGTEASSPIEGLIRDRDKVGQALSTIGDVEGFQRDVDIGTSGKDAALKRQQVRRETSLAALDQEDSLIRGEIEQRSLDAGEAPISRKTRSLTYDWARYFGLDTETATTAQAQAGLLLEDRQAQQQLGTGLGSVGIAPNSLGLAYGAFQLGSYALSGTGKVVGETEAIRSGVAASSAGATQQREPDPQMERQNALIEQQNKLLSSIERNTAPKPPTSKPNTAPPRPVASTGRQQGVAAGGPRP